MTEGTAATSLWDSRFRHWPAGGITALALAGVVIPGWATNCVRIRAGAADLQHGAAEQKLRSEPAADAMTGGTRCFKAALDASFATVAERATPADVKAALDTSAHCQDAFVTRAGTRNEAAPGWVTNVIVERAILSGHTDHRQRGRGGGSPAALNQIARGAPPVGKAK